MSDIYSIPVRTIEGEEGTLEKYRGRVMLFVNVASQCGFTSQYGGLETLYRKYRDRGLVVLGFPCNQFAHQEPGDEEEIRSFCKLNYDVTFPMFAKVEVNGPNAHPIYEYLKKARPGVLGTEAIKWNFTKFLVSHDGWVIRRFAPAEKPESLERDIERALEAVARAA